MADNDYITVNWPSLHPGRELRTKAGALP